MVALSYLGLCMDASLFGIRLQELRKAKGWSQRELAEAAKMSAAGVADLEHGRREPAWRTLISLAEALSVDLNAFTVEPADRPAPRRGRPRKTTTEDTPAVDTVRKAPGVASGASGADEEASEGADAKPRKGGKGKK